MSIFHAGRATEISHRFKDAALKNIETKILKRATGGYNSVSLIYKTAAEDTIFFGQNIEPVLIEQGYHVKKNMLTKSKWEFTISW